MSAASRRSFLAAAFAIVGLEPLQRSPLDKTGPFPLQIPEGQMWDIAYPHNGRTGCYEFTGTGARVAESLGRAFAAAGDKKLHVSFNEMTRMFTIERSA